MERDKFVGISKVGEKGQIVIPKEARDMFDIKPGDSIIVVNRDGEFWQPCPKTRPYWQSIITLIQKIHPLSSISRNWGD